MRGSSFKKKIVKFDIISGKGFIVHPEQILEKKKGKDFKLT